MPRTADVVVVGGGIVGLCVAHQLRARRLRVVVVERGRCGQGSTARATGGIRTQFGTEVNVRLSLRSLVHFREWPDRYGGDAGYRPIGYLFLATTPSQVEQLRRGVALQRACGARNQLLDRDEVARGLPGVVLDDVLAAAFGPDDGLGDPGAAVTSLVSACRRAGVEVLEETPMVRLQLDGGRPAGVVTRRGRIAAEAVVLATGVWTAPIARRLGLELPIAPHHRQVYRTRTAPGVPDRCPLTVDLGSGVYFHRDGPGLIFGGGDRVGEPGWDDRFRPEEAPRIVELLTRRLPAMADAELAGGWAGLREMTPDDLAAVGPLPGLDRVHVAAGFSGHGFMHAPAVGEIVAAGLCREAPPVDVSALDPARFQRQLQAEAYVF
ncbi:MAG TPA: FAD-binding oxidoreductase [Candidatus Dormibacteraeota bacterium]|jgi:sarcosine oxidase subunit beta|nr:FAD-binding oxidoreductase [Candidatus Dormibacteraeota bacterium]